MQMSPLPIINDTLRRWVSLRLPFHAVDQHRLVATIDGETKTYVGLYGSGPFSCEDLQTFLESLDFYVVDMASDPGFRGLTLILGEDDWDARALEDYLDRALVWAHEIEYPVRIYSQEMFLFRALAGIDPFDAPAEVLLEFGRGHPGLEYLANLGFDWPSCRAFPGKETAYETDRLWEKESPLHEMGYRVGRTGIMVDKRRRDILQKAFQSDLPNVGSAAYMSEWGAPNSSKRLKKIAANLATQVRNAKHRDAAMDLAIEHWEKDLAWLKQTFYTSRFRFHWPAID
jgi:hypothetical protein